VTTSDTCAKGKNIKYYESGIDAIGPYRAKPRSVQRLLYLLPRLHEPRWEARCSRRDTWSDAYERITADRKVLSFNFLKISMGLVVWQDLTCRSDDSIMVTMPIWKKGLLPASISVASCVFLCSMSGRCPKRTKATANANKARQSHFRLLFPSCKQLPFPCDRASMRCLAIISPHCYTS